MRTQALASSSSAARRAAAAALAALVALALCLALPQPAFAHDSEDESEHESESSHESEEEDCLCSGECGDCDWTLSTDGVLTISPTSGTSGTLDSISSSAIPWSDYADQITSVYVESGVQAGANLNSAFRDCSNLVSVDLSNLDTSNVTNMDSMFRDCTSLQSANLSGWSLPNVDCFSDLFENCTSLESVDLSDWSIPNVSDLYNIFADSGSLQSADLSGWDVSGVTDMSYMFNNKSSLESLDVSDWKLSCVEDMSCMFSNCSSLQSLDLSGWDFSTVTNMHRMFYRCSSLQSLDVSDWDVSSVECMDSMFYDCTSLKSLDPSSWDVSSVTEMESLFRGCESLESLDLSAWDTSSVEDMGYMFKGCSSLEYLDLSGWDNSNVSVFYSMDTESRYGVTDMFEECTGLRTVKLGSGFSFFIGSGGSIDSYCELPTPIDDDGTEGYWMNEDSGRIYAYPSDIPSNRTATYVAVFNVDPSTRGKYFTDVPESSSDKWYFDAVYELSDLGYITGYDDGSYGVGDDMTRGQFVTILWRMACPDEYADYANDAVNESGLSDVADGKYYTAAVNWGVENEVVTGYSDGSFGVNDSMSFQDMCLIIARYATDEGVLEGLEDSYVDGLLSDFTDADEVSSYARNGMAVCVEAELVGGNSDGTLAPKSDVARERVATVLWRAVENEVLIVDDGLADEGLL